MPTAKDVLFVLLGLFAALLCAVWTRELARRKEWGFPTVLQTVIGAVTNFFDTLGIGSFATTTTLYRWLRLVPDERIPGTLNVGHTIPTIVQAFIYIEIVEVEMTTLISLIGASVLGAWLGASVVTSLPRSRIQVGMGAALLVAALFVLGRLLGIFPDPTKGDAIGLEGELLITAIAANFVIGALMTIGIGAYAPIMILVSLLGMNEKTAFPIMMGSCAFLMPVAGARFIRTARFDSRAALGLALGGIPAVLVAALIVKSMNLTVVKWLVVVVVVYTALSMLVAAWRESEERNRKDAPRDAFARAQLGGLFGPAELLPSAEEVKLPSPEVSRNEDEGIRPAE